MRPVTPQEDLDANLTIDALVDIAGSGASLDALLVRKAELIVERAEKWQLAQEEAGATEELAGAQAGLAEAPEGPVRS